MLSVVLSIASTALKDTFFSFFSALLYFWSFLTSFHEWAGDSLSLLLSICSLVSNLLAVSTTYSHHIFDRAFNKAYLARYF